MFEQPPYQFEQQIVRRERLRWIAQNTTRKDLIIGDDTMDVPFYFDRESAVSFSPYPYTEYLDYKKLIGYVRKNYRRYEKIYLLVRNYGWQESELRYKFGAFIADIILGHLDQYPEIIPLEYLSDVYIFKVQTQLQTNTCTGSKSESTRDGSQAIRRFSLPGEGETQLSVLCNRQGLHGSSRSVGGDRGLLPMRNVVAHNVAGCPIKSENGCDELP